QASEGPGAMAGAHRPQWRRQDLHDGQSKPRRFADEGGKARFVDRHKLAIAQRIDCRAAGRVALDQRHLADDAARPDILIDDATAADSERAALDHIHGAWWVAFGE